MNKLLITLLLALVSAGATAQVTPGSQSISGNLSVGGNLSVTGTITGTGISGLPSIATGSTLANTSGATATPSAKPIPVINLQWMGACGITDATTIFTSAVTSAQSSGQPLYIPAGCTINHSGTLFLNGVQLLGDGIGSKLNATDTTATDPHQALYIAGNGVVIRGINFTSSSTTSTRSGQVYASAIAVRFGQGDTLTNFSIDHNYFTGLFAACFIELDYAGSYGQISYNQETGTALSNPNITQAPVNHLLIDHNLTSGTSGDTCWENVDYTASTNPQIQYIDISDNDMSNCGAHGISFLGAQHFAAHHNHIRNVSGRGIYIASENAGSSSEPTTFDGMIDHNDITGAATSSADFYVYVAGRTGYPVYNVTLAFNTLNITTATYAGFEIGSCNSCSSTDIETQGISIVGNVIVGDGTHGTTGFELKGSDDPTLEDNTIVGMQNSAIISTAGNTGTLKIQNNHFKNLSVASSGGYSAIALQNPGFSFVQVLGNSYTAGANAVSYFATCTSTGFSVQIGNNSGPTTTVNGCTATGPNQVAPPSTSSSACTTGQIALNTSYFYSCVSSNTWERAALSTF